MGTSQGGGGRRTSSRRDGPRTRAARSEETRRRIVEATVELHRTAGPASTSIGAIAARAGVTRPTVYSHFPDQRSLLRACTAHGFETDPPPDPRSWMATADPVERLRRALTELYGYYRRNASLTANVVRDMPTMPVLREIFPLPEVMAAMRDMLAAAWGPAGAAGATASADPERRRLLAAIGHAIDFSTWRSLTQPTGLSDAEAIDLMVALVSTAARREPARRRLKARWSRS